MHSAVVKINQYDLFQSKNIKYETLITVFFILLGYYLNNGFINHYKYVCVIKTNDVGGVAMKKYFFDKNFLSGFIFLFVSLFYLISSYFIETKGIVSVEADFMPKIYGFFLLLSSLVLMFTSYLKIRKSQNNIEEGNSDWKRIFYVIFLIVIYIILMQFIGFILTSVPFLFFLSILLTPSYINKKYWVYLLFSVLLPLIAYFIFSYYLNLTMPSGIFF